MPFSVLILTLNEEISLPRLLDRLHGVSDDIIVLDSFSDDATRDIARSRGCRVFERHFDNERSHRTYANSLPFRYPWVYNPDADELPDDQLLEEMQRAATAENPAVAYEVRFRNYLDGIWIRRSTDYPVWVVRFFRPESLTFDREINLRYIINGPTERFTGHFDHYPFAKGIAWWISKHNTYSTNEAREALKVLESTSISAATARVFTARESKERRMALKELSFFLPFRGAFRFLYSYMLRFGFLDGRAGLKYCSLIAFYEFMISEKVRELRKDGQSRK